MTLLQWIFILALFGLVFYEQDKIKKRIDEVEDNSNHNAYIPPTETPIEKFTRERNERIEKIKD